MGINNDSQDFSLGQWGYTEVLSIDHGIRVWEEERKIKKPNSIESKIRVGEQMETLRCKLSPGPVFKGIEFENSGVIRIYQCVWVLGFLNP